MRKSATILRSLVLLLIALPAWAAYVPPVGIPAPTFGIDEALPNTATYCPNWPTSANGGTDNCYYVSSSGSDSGNPFGYPSAPRLTIPSTLNAGSYVEVVGTFNTASVVVTASGTLAKPVFIHGAGAVYQRDFYLLGSTYTIVDNVAINSTTTSTRVFAFVSDATRYTHHAAIRNSTFTGPSLQTTSFNSVIQTSGVAANWVNDIVSYNNTIAGYGSMSTVDNTEQDIHAHKTSAYTYNAWVLGNTAYSVTGDGIQVGDATIADDIRPHHIYIGGNHFYSTGENGVDVKNSRDVIISMNDMHGFHPTTHSSGEAITIHNSPDNVWSINNKLYDAGYGIYASGSVGIYDIGNIIWGIKYSTNSASFYDVGQGILQYSSSGAIANNTIDNCQHGFGIVGNTNTPTAATGNIVSNRSLAAGQDQTIESTSRGHTINYTMTSGSTKTRYGGASYTTGAQFAATGQGTNYWEANPSFTDNTTNDYHLSAGSPGIDNGVLAGAYATFYNLYGISIAQDYDNNSRPANGTWDLGAYEGAGSDTTPNPFSFTDNTGVALSTVIYSDNVTMAGLDNTATISITGTGCEYRINLGSWTADAGTIAVGDNLALRTTSSGSYATAVNCVPNAGGTTDTWSVTTAEAAAPDATPIPPKSRMSVRGGWR